MNLQEEIDYIESILNNLRNIRDNHKVADRLKYNPACDKLAILLSKLIDKNNQITNQ